MWAHIGLRQNPLNGVLADVKTIRQLPAGPVSGTILWSFFNRRQHLGLQFWRPYGRRLARMQLVHQTGDAMLQEPTFPTRNRRSGGVQQLLDLLIGNSISKQ